MRTKAAWFVCLIGAALTAPTVYGVPGVIIKAGTGQQLPGDIYWQQSKGVYVVTPSGSPVQITVTPREVQQIKVVKPADYDGALQQIQKGDYAGAIPALSRIVDAYTMLEWDATAARWLAECYLQTKTPKKAVEVCEKVIEQNPKAGYSTDMAPLYWESLVETDQFAKLRKAIDDEQVAANPDLAALAEVKRGDINHRENKPKDALVNGYLRAIVIYQDVKSVQPEALYKAVKCFEELGQTAYAEKMRRRLLTEYPQDPYADKIKSGG